MSSISSWPWRSLFVAALALGLAAVPGASGPLLLERDATLAAEGWRLFSGHLIHFTPYHLAWDAGALVLLGLLFERELGRRWWSLLLASALTVSFGVLLLAPGIETYGGLSGVLNGLWVGGALFAARIERLGGRTGPSLFLVACVAAAVGKVALEAFGGAPLFTEVGRLGGQPVPIAHACGALAGALWVATAPPRTREVEESPRVDPMTHFVDVVEDT